MSVAVPAESVKETSEFDLDVRVRLDEPTAVKGASYPTVSILACTVVPPTCG
ncbi:hypothetical protein JK364_30210 [Streptomyces sp. 110]|uniref:Lantibiotic n=1 Tax=Streptomyces endocoffeicus TaxID=2898945 RepID=A0ABS1PX49_9ACTN|nr:hypothetical protein [Streptomyces endocoffeicus]MBL1116634.1 hypothetical protein [Streptomyces endocoffeicus]